MSAHAAQETASSDHVALRELLAKVAHGNSGRVDVWDIASTGFYTGMVEYLPDAHSKIARIVIAGFRPRERAPGLLLGALENLLRGKAVSGSAASLDALLDRVAQNATGRIDVWALPDGAGYRGLVEYMPDSSTVMTRIVIQGVRERDRVETLLLRALEDLVGRAPK